MSQEKSFHFVVRLAARHTCMFLLVVSISLAGVVPYAQAAGSILYVKPESVGDCSSWANACTLQTALSNAVSGDQIWVVTGTYKPTTTGDRSVTFQLKEGVAVYGGFAGTETALELRDWAKNVVILNGDLNGDNSGYDNNGEDSYHVVTGANEATLDGVTVINGNANGASVPDDRGGGMYNLNTSNLTLSNIIFSDNLASLGGGIYNSTGDTNNINSSPTLTNVTFINNMADWGGGMLIEDSNPTLTNVTFTGNTALYNGTGGGIYSIASNPTLIDVSFISNTAYSGGGMFNSYSYPTLTNVIFNSNTASDCGGGIYNTNSGGILNNITFKENIGDGMCNENNSSPTLNSVTFSKDGMINSYSSPTLTNATFSGLTWGHRLMSNANSNPTLINVTFDGLETSSSGMSNANSNPTLINVTFSNNGGRDNCGAMENSDSSPTLINVAFDHNYANYSPYGDRRPSGGAMCNYGGSPILINVTFYSNWAAYGGGMFNENSNPSLTNVTFFGNYTTEYGHGVGIDNSGGGMYNSNSSPRLTNVTFSGNGSKNGGGMYNSNSSLIIRNSILWGDSGGEITNVMSSTVTVSYSDVQGGFPGIGNINADPLLGDWGLYGGAVHTIPLLPGSPAIDATSSNCPVTDARGMRRSSPNCDLGAFELTDVSYIKIYLSLITR